MKNAFLKKTGENSYKISVPPWADAAEPIIIKNPLGLKIVIGKNSNIKVAVEFNDKCRKKRLHCNFDIRSRANSRLKLTISQNLPKTSELSMSCEAMVEEKAELNLTCAHFGGKKTKVQMSQKITGSGAVCDIDLAAHCQSKQNFKFDVQNVFTATKCRGTINLRGVAQDKSSLKILGAVKILRLAKKTDVHLNQAVLNLGHATLVQATPIMEIQTNDVKASHSSSVTNVTKEDVFYMQSRGLSKEICKKLLIKGFLFSYNKNSYEFPQ